jgi:hypothetical protein
MKVFGEGAVVGLFNERGNALRAEVYNQERNYLLNVNEAEYVAYLVARHSLVPVVLDRSGLYVTDREDMIPAEQFPADFNVFRGRRYPKQVLTFHLPFQGDPELIGCTPSSYISWTREVEVSESCICFDLGDFYGDAARLQSELERILNAINQQAQNLFQEVEQWNRRLEGEAAQVVRARKDSFLKQAGLLASIGVPVKRAASVPSTFTVPLHPRKVVIRPAAPNSSFTPEPTMDDASYGEILRMLSEFGREMERHPSVYAGRDEETLRDHLIMVLTPQFQSVGGETFNKKGKTDILVRHEGANLFVAECKFWKGPKGYQDTISQLLSYLTWRDSKTAILLFVRNREFQPVLDQIAAETARHENFVKFHGGEAEGRFRFEFRLPDDQHRRVWLTVLCFHFPDS